MQLYLSQIISTDVNVWVDKEHVQYNRFVANAALHQFREGIKTAKSK